MKLNKGTPLATLGPNKMMIKSASDNLQLKTLFSAANIDDIQKNLNLSNLQAKHLVEDLWQAFGSRMVIEPNLIDNLRHDNHYFEVKQNILKSMQQFVKIYLDLLKR